MKELCYFCSWFKSLSSFLLVNTERQNSFFLLDEDGKRLGREHGSLFMSC